MGLRFLLCCVGFLGLHAGALAQTSARPDATPPAIDTAPRHSHEPEITAEDVPDHEPHPLRRWSVRAGYVLWLMKNAETPPLASTGLNTDPRPGVLGSASARVIYGGEIDLESRSGAAFSLTRSFGEEERLALEIAYAFAANRQVGFFTGSAGTSASFSVLARPFLDVVNNREDASLVAFPQLAAGSIDVKYGTYFDTGELNLSWQLAGCDERRLDLIGGFRVCRLEEELTIQEQVSVNAAAPRFAGQTIRVRDSFETDNVFYGGQLGLKGMMRKKRWQLEGFGKLALGVVDHDLVIRGATSITGDPTYYQAGLLALASNSGVVSGNDFCVIPEIGVQLGLRPTERLQLFFGYSFLYWNQVTRPGQQVDRGLNPNLIPTSDTFGAAGGPPRPIVPNNLSDFWVHGLRFGLEWKF